MIPIPIPKIIGIITPLESTTVLSTSNIFKDNLTLLSIQFILIIATLSHPNIQAQAADAGSGQADGDDAARVPAGAAGAQGSTARRVAVSGGRARFTLGRPLFHTRCQ